MKTIVIIAAVVIAGFCIYAWAQSAGRAKALSPKDFAKELASDSTAYLLDVRRPDEYAAGHLEGAHNLDWLNKSEFADGVEHLPKDRTIYAYCRSGMRSAAAAKYLTERGYKVVDLKGGYTAWQSSHLPTTSH